MNSHSPPGFTSMVSIVLVKPSGPHQLRMCSGLVQTSHTSSRGASSSLEMASSRPAVSGAVSLFFSIFFMFFFYFTPVIFKRVEFGIPELPVLLHPGRHLLQLVELGFAIALPALLPDHHQSALRQDLHVLRYGRAALTEVLRHGI